MEKQKRNKQQEGVKLPDRRQTDKSPSDLRPQQWREERRRINEQIEKRDGEAKSMREVEVSVLETTS